MTEINHYDAYSLSDAASTSDNALKGNEYGVLADMLEPRIFVWCKFGVNFPPTLRNQPTGLIPLLFAEMHFP